MLISTPSFACNPTIIEGFLILNASALHESEFPWHLNTGACVQMSWQTRVSFKVSRARNTDQSWSTHEGRREGVHQHGNLPGLDPSWTEVDSWHLNVWVASLAGSKPIIQVLEIKHLAFWNTKTVLQIKNSKYCGFEILFLLFHLKQTVTI